MWRRPAVGRAVLASGLLTASCVDAPARSIPSDLVEIPGAPLTACAVSLPAASIDTVAMGLDIPWDVTFLSDGRALVTERPGAIRLIDAGGRLRDEPWATLPVFDNSETGLLGIDRTPGTSTSGVVDVYVAGTFEVATGDNPVTRAVLALGRRAARALDPDRGQTRYLRVFRIRERDGIVEPPEVVVDGLADAPVHSGGALRFGPDGMLWVTKGDATEPEWARDPRSMRGKILRYRPDGSLPADNPLPNSPIWASGMRDSQGLAWHPSTGELFAIEHSPSASETGNRLRQDDELNVVGPGADLGWPIATGQTLRGGLTSPIAIWNPSIAPGGLAIYTAESSPWNGNVFVTGLRGSTLRRLEVERGDSGWHVACEDQVLGPEHGRLRLVRPAPDGSLWVGTSNRDQNGTPRPGDDLILRLEPPAS